MRGWNTCDGIGALAVNVVALRSKVCRIGVLYGFYNHRYTQKVLLIR